MRKIILTVFLGLIFISNIEAQQKLTLADAIERGLENNYSLRISTKSVEVSEENNSWGTAGRFPTIDIGIRSVNRFDRSFISIGAQFLKLFEHP